MRIRMLTSKVLPLEGGGRIVFGAGSYYVTAPGTVLTDELATEWILAGEAEDEAGVVKRPEPEPAEPIPAPPEPAVAVEPAPANATEEGGLVNGEDSHPNPSDSA